MPVFAGKGAPCPQCAAFKQRVKMDGAAHLQHTMHRAAEAVAAGVLRDMGKEADPQWGNSLEECRTLGSGGDCFGWYDTLFLCFECTRCRRRYRLGGDTYHGNVWWEQCV
ncbi:Uncharacterised protein [Kingella potus]|uniref:Uncharacterized protein n=1 Tax=Kingella potus TaxID=265175 RepID=A0A377R4H6_9NEIS|nr:hypothetical protein [Kingella potus]UOP00098.1 hypothetical protein LVJ84_08970 [Kingella potus]STR03391.1 Uncharacterised protein [Kingella potus]